MLLLGPYASERFSASLVPSLAMVGDRANLTRDSAALALGWE